MILFRKLIYGFLAIAWSVEVLRFIFTDYNPSNFTIGVAFLVSVLFFVQNLLNELIKYNNKC